jgi:thiamine-phosphate diphosphorylase
VCVLLTERLCARSWQATLDAALEGGADCIQVREKDFTARELATRVRAVLAQVNNRAAVIVNDRADVALAAGADGVHVGIHDLAISDIRKLAGTRLLVGASTHSLAEAAAAIDAGADYCGVGAMFPTSTKPSVAPQGEPYLRAFLAAHPGTPHLAIGGITPANVRALITAGARGVAVSSCVCAARDPAAAVRTLREAFP